MTFISITHIVTATIGLVLLYRIALILYRLYFHPLSKYPGPKHLAISALPQLYHQNLQGTFYKHIRDLHDRYGNIVRVAPNELSIDGSVGWAGAFGHRKAGEAEFSKDKLFYKPLDEGKGIDGSGVQDIFTSNRVDHRRMRRLLSHAFSDSALSEQEDIVQSYVELLMQRLNENADAGNSLDMVQYFNWTTFDIIGDLTFGEPFRCLETNTMHPWIRVIFPLIRSGATLRIFNEYPFLKSFLQLLITEKTRNRTRESLAFTGSRLEKRIALGKDTPRKDFMTYILRHNDERGMVHQEILTTSESLILAGSETTATLLSGLTYLLARHPSVWQKLTAEVRSAFKTEMDITMRATAALPYLHACLEEGLRFYPPAGLTPPRISPGAMVNGEYIPEGTKIWIHQWSTYHRESNFRQANDFIPERWLPSAHPLYDPNFVNDNRACMQPFSVGPRDCIGKNLAYAEMRVVLARVAWNFELELIPESQSWMEEQKCFIVYQKPPLMMKLHRRAMENGIET